MRSASLCGSQLIVNIRRCSRGMSSIPVKKDIDLGFILFNAAHTTIAERYFWGQRMTKTGRCLCGKIKFEYAGQETWACYCHCKDCTRNCAAPVVAFIGVELASFSWRLDGPDAHPKYFSSSAGVKRFFCDACGTPMAFQADHYEGEIHLYAATLDQPEDFKPSFHVHHASKLSWFDIDDALQKHPHSAPEDPLDRS